MLTPETGRLPVLVKFLRCLMALVLLTQVGWVRVWEGLWANAQHQNFWINTLVKRYKVVCVHSVRQQLLHRDAFGEVSWFIDVAAAGGGDVVGEELEGDGGQEGVNRLEGFGDVDDIVGDLGNL